MNRQSIFPLFNPDAEFSQLDDQIADAIGFLDPVMGDISDVGWAVDKQCY